MAQGNYDHPSYLTRQQIFLGKSVAGASGTSCYFGAPASNIRVREVAVTVITAGTATSTLTIQNGTSSVGNIVVGTQAAGTVLVSGDCNTTVAQGTSLNVKNGADAVVVFQAVAEAYIDPASTWTGGN